MSRSASRLGRHIYRPRLETLEDRQLPAVNFAAAFRLGAPPSDLNGSAGGHDIVTDSAANLYVTGSFAGNLDADPANIHIDNSDLLTSIGGGDGFVAKYGSDGSFQWARRFGSGAGADDNPTQIAVDGSGNLYIAGTCADGADFGGLSVPTGGYFVTKLDAAGNFLWVRATQNAPMIGAISLAVSTTGQLYTGHQDSTTGQDFIIDRLNPADGGLIWTTGAMGSTYNDAVRGVSVDSTGNVYACGVFSGSVDFDPGPGTYTLSGGGRASQPAISTFVLKLTSSGTFGWAKVFTGSNWDAVGSQAITLDSSGAVYVAGSFDGQATFGSGKGAIKLTSFSTLASDVFVAKLDSSGNTVWAKQLSGSGEGAIAYDLTVDANNVYTTGFFSSTTDFNPGSGVANITCAGGRDAFVSVLTRAGNYVWAGALAGPGGDQGNGIAVDGFGNIYTTGSFSGTADFDPSAATYPLTITGNGGNGFISKLAQTNALRAADGSPPKVIATTAISQAQASQLLSAALLRWRQVGVDITALRGVTVQVTDLPGNLLGLQGGNIIYIDSTAAGHGWFIDPTPMDDTEFRLPGSQGEQGKMDLLSVVMHEMGHVLGRGHSSSGLMAETLAVGTRTAPKWLADASFLQELLHPTKLTYGIEM